MKLEGFARLSASVAGVPFVEDIPMVPRGVHVPEDNDICGLCEEHFGDCECLENGEVEDASTAILCEDVRNYNRYRR